LSYRQKNINSLLVPDSRRTKGMKWEQYCVGVIKDTLENQWNDTCFCYFCKILPFF